VATITPAVNPNKLAGLGKWLVKYGIPFAINALEDVFTDGVGQVATPETSAWRRVNWRFTRATPSGTVEDVAMFGFDIVNMTGGDLDSSWTAADYTAVDAALSELWTTIRPLISGTHTLSEIQYHQRAFHPDLPLGELVPQMQPGTNKEVNRFARSGPALHVLTKNEAGSNVGAAAPYQVALSVSFRTAARRHWGRCYIPGATVTEVGGGYGRFSSGTTQVVANAFAELASDLGANDFFIMVPSTQNDSKYATSLQSVAQIQVDDVPDVIRRRRPKQASLRSIGVPTP